MKPTLNSQALLKGLKPETPPLKIFEPLVPQVIECETTEDFNQIINTDIERYKMMTTQHLNRMFKIPGCKVAKLKGEICLRSIKPCERQDSVEIEHLKAEIYNIKEAFNQLSEQFEIIKQALCGGN